MLIQSPAPSSIAAATVEPRPHLDVPVPARRALGRRVEDAFQARSAPRTPRSRAGRVGERAASGRVQRARAACVCRRDPDLVGEPAQRRAEGAQAVLPCTRSSRQRAQRAAVPGTLRPRCTIRAGIGERHELGVRVVERRARRGALVHRRQHVPAPPASARRGALRQASSAVVEHRRRQVAQRGHVRGPVDHDLLAGEGRELVRDDAHGPARAVRRRAGRPAEGRISGGVIASWPSQNGQCSASAIRVVRPCAPGRRGAAGRDHTGSPVSGLRAEVERYSFGPRSPSSA